ncbi:MAG: phosphoribosylamine--glycine ligase [Pseudomonadota bacterium]
MMKILVVGSGGREHALVWRLATSEKCEALYCAPGNTGIADIADCVDIQATDLGGITAFAQENAIDIVVVGPEDPLCAGLVDKLEEAGIKAFGPNKDAAILEGSKAFMKDFCKKYDIPTAAYGRFTDVSEAKAFIDQQGAPIVVKTDGLAAGKGVLICETIEDAHKAAEEMLSGEAFGAAGNEIIVEEFMEGEELSFFAISDGETVLPFQSAQDHKRAGDGDTGLNTGGMGAYSPAHMFTPDLEQKIMDRIIIPTVEGMKADGRAYKGVLYAGLMLTAEGPKLIEYNIRFGDPECQVILTRLGNDFLDVIDAAVSSDLKRFNGSLNWSHKISLTVVMASNGYPGSYTKGTVIEGVNTAENYEGVKVFHAGTARNENGELTNIGGRVLNVTAGGENIGHAKRLAYEAIEKINWPDGFCRSDIGWRAVKAAQEKAA